MTDAKQLQCPACDCADLPRVGGDANRRRCRHCGRFWRIDRRGKLRRDRMTSIRRDRDYLADVRPPV